MIRPITKVNEQRARLWEERLTVFKKGGKRLFQDILNKVEVILFE